MFIINYLITIILTIIGFYALMIIYFLILYHEPIIRTIRIRCFNGRFRPR